MYFVEDGAGGVYLVIEPNDVIPPGAEIGVKVTSLGVWIGGLADVDGSFTSQPFRGLVGEAVQVSVGSGDERWGVCVIVGNFGRQPELCP